VASFPIRKSFGEEFKKFITNWKTQTYQASGGYKLWSKWAGNLAGTYGVQEMSTYIEKRILVFIFEA